MNLETVFQRLKPTNPLRSILAGDVPDTEWELIPTPQLESSLAKAIGQWEFIGSAFRIGCRDERCRVPLLPMLHCCALVVGRVPSLPMAVQLVQSSPLADGDSSARTYSAFTGFLREIACSLELVKKVGECSRILPAICGKASIGSAARNGWFKCRWWAEAQASIGNRGSVTRRMTT
jgi:hypothetical protein